MLQHNRQLTIISGNLEKKIKAELTDMEANRREDYEKFFAAFGRQIKFGIASDYGMHKELLQDLLLFYSAKEKKQGANHQAPHDSIHVRPACWLALSFIIT